MSVFKGFQGTSKVHPRLGITNLTSLSEYCHKNPLFQNANLILCQSCGFQFRVPIKITQLLKILIPGQTPNQLKASLGVGTRHSPGDPNMQIRTPQCQNQWKATESLQEQYSANSPKDNKTFHLTSAPSALTLPKQCSSLKDHILFHFCVKYYFNPESLLCLPTAKTQNAFKVKSFPRTAFV